MNMSGWKNIQEKENEHVIIEDELLFSIKS